MKKISLITIPLFVLLIIISSCKKTSSSTSIVGKWKITSILVKTVDSTTTPFTISQFTPTSIDTAVVVFNSNNTFSYSDSSTDPKPEIGTYNILGDSLNMTSVISGYTISNTDAFNLSGNVFTLFVFSSHARQSTLETEVFNRQ